MQPTLGGIQLVVFVLDSDYTPSTSTIKKIMKAIREIQPEARTEDFFDL
ncbi:hypothetical protein [Halalkalibacter alkalisediminis]|uniref:Uncharacterized protein n=1 Tax=Halalkalibacter alkalisediminis TaxID=935616 RepID=A0ABV6NGC2_9BACI|nr:hypothetical protein [Halalkalibacter alkalisediminis]